LRDSPLNTADSDSFDGPMVPGASCVDAPVHAAGQPAWLLQQLGQQFTGVLFCGEQGIDQTTQAALDALRSSPIPLKLVVVTRGDAQVAAASGANVLHDVDGLAAARYDAKPGTFYLIRPDQHVCARQRQLDVSLVASALKRALCVEGTA
jgi:3-(3-hydroxy-phenyl)propionate hydroxylase